MASCFCSGRSHSFLVEVLLISILFQENLYCSECVSSRQFLQQPENKTVHVGENVSFQCSLQSEKTFISAFVFWENGLTQKLKTSKHTTSISFNVTTRLVMSDLTVDRVSRQHDGEVFKCTILLHFLHSARNVFSSDFGKLCVQFFLDDGDLQCTDSSEGSVLREGDNMLLLCQGPVGNPPIQIRWVDKRLFRLSNIAATISGNISSVSGNVMVTKSIHNAILICVATSFAFPGQSRNCSVGPFIVFYRPEVHVTPSQAEMIPMVVAELNLYCLANAFPEVEAYSWSCERNALISNCDSRSQNLTIHVKDVQSEGFVNVTCEAANPVGSSQNHSVIAIRQTISDGIPVCLLDDTSTALINLHPRISYRNKSNWNTFRCYTAVDQIRKVNFRWYLNRLILSEQGAIHVVIDTSSGPRLIAQSHVDEGDFGVITCEIVLSNSPLLRTFCLSNTNGSTELFPRQIYHKTPISEVSSLHENVSNDLASELDGMPEALLGTKCTIIIVVGIGLCLILVIASLSLILHRAKLRRGRLSCQSPAAADQPQNEPDPVAGSSATERRVVYDIPNYGSRGDVWLHHAMRDSQSDEKIYENRYLKNDRGSGRPTSDEASEVYSSNEDESHDFHSRQSGDDEYMDMSRRNVTYVNGHDVLESVNGVTGTTGVTPHRSNSPKAKERVSPGKLDGSNSSYSSLYSLESLTNVR